jgi:neurofibromin 1
MGLVVGTCFQHNPATQPQAITVLGYLACDEVDDDLVYQVLVSMSTSLSHLSDTDVTLLASMLRCLSRVIPGLTPDSRYATSLFWLAFAVAQLSSIPLFGPALELMYTSLKTLSEDTRVDRVMDHLLEYRSTMGEPARRIDQIAGISFDHEPSFSLVAILNKGFRHPSTKSIAVQVATTLLEITASSAAPDDDSVMIPKSSVPYFVALLPIAAKDQTELKQLFLAAGLDVDPDVVFDVENMAVLNLLSVP